MRLPSHIPALSVVALLLGGCALLPASRDTSALPSATGAQLVEEVFDDTASASVVPEADIVERVLPAGLLEIGEPKAPVSMLLFTEYHCGYCKDFQEEHMPLLLQDFVETGTLRMQISIVPLKKYLDSDLTALGLICATQQNAGLAMHGALFAEAANADSIQKIAAGLKLDTSTFDACMKSNEARTMLTAMRELAKSLDVTLVPTLFINGHKSVGLPYYADLRGEIEKAVSGK